jgi:restriction endonuclease Mrr
VEAMAVPEIFTMYIPTLRLADGKVIGGANDIVEAIAAEYNLSEQDLAEPNGGGTQTKIVNNASFSLVHLQAAKMLKKIGENKGYLTTEHGQRYLRSGLKPKRLKDIMLLK